jgi:thiamine-monophosphate kinase
VARNANSGPSQEDRLIARHFAPIARHPGAWGLTDDAATYSPPSGHDLVVTADAIVAGVHFFADDRPGDIARKALRVNLSDLAAKGAAPAGFLVSLALPKKLNMGWLMAFARGLGADAKAFSCPLLGGDTVITPGPLMVSVAAFGTLPARTTVRRAGARVGDHVFVTGTIGDAALGLKLREDAKLGRRLQLPPARQRHLLQRYLVPQPRNAMAFAVRKYATAAMDVSDGLAGDLAKLCRVSGVAAVVDVSRVPLSVAARRAVDADPGLMQTVLSGGDDYEILCTVRPARVAAFVAAARAVGVPVAAIGRVVRGSGASLLGPDGKPVRLAKTSFSHF